MSGKPRHPPEVPGGGTEIIRELHGKIQEAKEATRELRAVAGAGDILIKELEALAGRIDEAISEEVIRSRIDSLLSDDALHARLSPIVDEVGNRLLMIGDAAKEVLEERETQFVAHMTAVLGIKDPETLITLLAGMIVGEVMDAVEKIQEAKEAQAKAVREMTERLPDMSGLLTKLSDATPVPPRAKKRSGGFSHNQVRKRASP
jgi:hypothetical protein